MKTLLIYTSLLFLTAFASCQDKNNIIVTGQITDESTGQPISKAEVLVLCWYMSSIDDASFKKQTLFTDDKGNYKTTFDKGHQIDVASKANDYIANRSYNKLSDNHVLVNLKLAKAKENPTLKKLLNNDSISLDALENTLFLRVRVYSKKNSNLLDFSNVETFGFDLHTLTSKTDTSSCDIWFKLINKEEQPNIIVANKGGGIIPIYADQINSSFLFDKPVAPSIDYKKEYKLTGNEVGFFVLCRDGKTFGKIIFEQSQIDASIPDGKGGFYKEFGKHFGCLYQPNGTTDLSFSIPDINLQNFLVDIRML